MPEIPEKQLRVSLKNSILDGGAYGSMLGLTQDYVAPFALALKATTFQVGLLTSIPNLMIAASQLIAPRLAERAGSRKRLILPVVLVHALVWLPILLTPYIFPSSRAAWLIALWSVSNFVGTMGNPPWSSWMADLVPAPVRGRYFGLRGRISGVCMVLFFFVGGGILQFSQSNIFLGFSVVFAGAMLFRLASFYFLAGMYEPGQSRPESPPHNYLQIMRTLPATNPGRFIIYVALVYYANYIASPFFAVLMLRDLQASYSFYVAVQAAFWIAQFAFMTYWGRRADRWGNTAVLRFASLLIPVVPLLWIPSQQIVYLVLVQSLSGFAWAGFNLCSANFLLEGTEPAERTRYIAVFNAMNALAMCLGALTGAVLVSHLPPLLGHSILSVFLVSGVLRAILAGTAFRFKEVRRLSAASNIELLLGKSTDGREGTPPDA